MNATQNSHSTQKNRTPSRLLWFAGIFIFLLVCVGLTAPGGYRFAQAQGISPTLTPPTPSQCMYVAYSFATETSVVVGVRNNTGITTRLSTATLDWPSALGGAGGDYVDYFTFYTGTFYTGNDTAPPTSAVAPGTGTAYDIANNITREFVAGFGPLPLPNPLAGSFTVTLTFTNGCSVSVTVTRPVQPTPTPQVTNTPVAGQCNVAFAYVTELTIVVGVSNNTAANVRLSTTTLDWPTGLGGTGGDYVDYFQFGGNQFYNGNDTAPTTAATPANNTTYQITPGQTRNFVAAFGLAPLPRPLYGTFTVTLTFRSGCSPITVSVVRAPPPATCPTITHAYFSGAGDLYFVVYNGLAVDTYFTGANLNWPDIPTPNRTVNYFSWGTDQFYGGNDASPPTAATDPTPDLFRAGQSSYFRVNFTNPGVLAGTFSVTLNFSVPCSATYTLGWGLTPTPTPTPTITPTRTATPTPIPLAGASSVRFSAMILNAHDYGLDAQTIEGSVGGGDGPPYVGAVAVITVEDPSGDRSTYVRNVAADGTFRVAFSDTDVAYDNFGCDEEGIWEAWFEVTDGSGNRATSTTITWAVNFPRVHGIP